MQATERFCLRAAGASGALALACGAFGAHALGRLTASLPPEAAAKAAGWVETGARFQLAHAAALLALAALAPRLKPRAAAWSGRLLFFGSLLFAASLYALALGAPRALAALAPLGGLGLLGGWAALLFAL